MQATVDYRLLERLRADKRVSQSRRGATAERGLRLVGPSTQADARCVVRTIDLRD